MALTFAKNFRSIRLTEEASDEFCVRAGEGEGRGRGTEGGYIGRSGLQFRALRACSPIIMMTRSRVIMIASKKKDNKKPNKWKIK